MSKREIAIIGAVLIAGFIAFEVVIQFNGVERDEVAPGESPELTDFQEIPVDEQMTAWVAAVRLDELDPAMRERYPLPERPADTGMLAVVGNPGEYFFSKQLDGRGEVWVMKADGPELLWGTDTEQLLELVGARGDELFIKFVDQPYAHPRDAWQPGGFYGLNMFAPGMGVYPSHIDDEIVAMIRRDIR